MTLIKQIKLFLINVFSGVQVKQKRNRERQLSIAEMVHRTNKQIFFLIFPVFLHRMQGLAMLSSEAVIT